MTNLLAEARRFLSVVASERDIYPISMNQFIDYFNYQGKAYPYQTLQGGTFDIGSSWSGFINGAYKTNGPVFACVLARLMLFAEARLTFRQRSNGRPGALFGTQDLRIFEEPWTDGTTFDLLARAIVDVDLGGNFFVARRPGNRLVRMRPDWVTFVFGGQGGTAADLDDLDVEVIGYLYHPGGLNSDDDPVPLLANQVAHWYPVPDPEHPYRGISWIQTVLGEIASDSLATQHKSKFYENGATPNMIVTLDPAVKEESFDRWVKKFRDAYEGVSRAYKTVFLGGGAKAEVVGANLAQLDLRNTQGKGETRIAAAAGVPPIIAGFSEGLEAATYSNYAQARRRFADMTIRPLWRNFCGSMAKLTTVPGGAELWYDDRDIPALLEDAKDRAEIANTQAETINRLVTAGFKPETIVQAVLAEDYSLLQHTGLFSVQLQPPQDGTQPVLPPDQQAGRALAALIKPHLLASTN